MQITIKSSNAFRGTSPLEEGRLYFRSLKFNKEKQTDG